MVDEPEKLTLNVMQKEEYMTEEFDSAIEELWTERVAGRYLYRGMGMHDLKEGLNPDNDPFNDIRPQLFHLIEILEKALSQGFEFTVHEDYSGYSFSLNDIIAWSRGDLENPGLDFTSVYDDACGYSKNFNGSQLKQNFKYITDHIPERADDPILQSEMGEEDWNVIATINAWLTDGDTSHDRVVVWVKRSQSAFDENRDCLPLGSLPIFRRNLIHEIENRGLPLTIDSAISVLPKQPDGFCYRLTTGIPLNDIENAEMKNA